MIPAMESIIKVGGQKLGITEIVFGMPHRGRLNMLGNAMRSSASSSMNSKWWSANPDVTAVRAM
jgi:2-oxoglutarate dehydrogenase E1 component